MRSVRLDALNARDPGEIISTMGILMGVLHYGKQIYEFDDRLLAHLQVVVFAKRDRGESFFLTWIAGRGVGAVRRMILITSDVSIDVEFAGGHTPAIDPASIEALTMSATSELDLASLGN